MSEAMKAEKPAGVTLDRIGILKPLSPEQRRAIEQRSRWRRYVTGEVIIDRNSESRDVCFVAQGQVRIVNYALSGRVVAYDDVDAGGLFGELAAIDGSPRSASVEALTDSTVVAFLGRLAFLDLLGQHSALALAVLTRLAQVVRNSTERILDLSVLGANNRVHAELLRRAKPKVRPDNTAVISPIPVHADIAARVSATRETVARVLSDLTKSGLIERRGNGLVVRSVDELEAMVEEVRG